VITVALACGFTSPSHFSKCYRGHYNRTPYRERGVADAASRGAPVESRFDAPYDAGTDEAPEGFEDTLEAFDADDEWSGRTDSN
jgi:AraC-like DNA-binding protein